MSGLAVLFHRDHEPVQPRLLTRMLDAVPYRGRDGMWTRLEDYVGLGIARLVTTRDEVSEQQPILSRRTGASIVADVRLDNRAELISALGLGPGARTSDAELILYAYDAWGVDAVTRLIGDFAFAIWDARAQRLVCARDTSGQRSLFYRVTGSVFAVASEIHQLLQDPNVAIRPDEERIKDYLTPINVARNEADQAATFFDGIRAVPAGHVVQVDADRFEVRKYWDLSPVELRYRREEDYEAHFRALFSDVVRARLRGAGAIGALLSGGIDSTSVVCMAQELYRSGLAEDRGFTSYSLVFGALECDERGFLSDTQAKYGFKARWLPGSASVSNLEVAPAGFMRGPGKPRSELDAIFAAAAHDGVRVLLSGDVADACAFGSRRVFDSLLRNGRFVEAWRQMRRYHDLAGQTWRKILAVDTAFPLLPLSLQRRLMVGYAQRVVQRERDQLLPWWIAPELRQDLWTRHLGQTLEAERTRRFANPTRHDEYRMLFPPEVPYSTAGFPLEVWRPYADRRLQEFLLAIPPETKFSPHAEMDTLYAGGKRIVRRSLRGIMPESVRTRTAKTHFASLVDDELRRRWADYERVFGPGGRSELAARGYIDPTLFWARLNQVHQHGWGGDVIYLMRVLWLETWLRTLQLPRAVATKVNTQGRGCAEPANRAHMSSVPVAVPLSGGAGS